jgi:hypothetical protein
LNAPPRAEIRRHLDPRHDEQPAKTREALNFNSALVDNLISIRSSALIGCSAEEEGETTWLSVRQEQDGAEDGIGQAEDGLA